MNTRILLAALAGVAGCTIDSAEETYDFKVVFDHDDFSATDAQILDGATVTVTADGVTKTGTTDADGVVTFVDIDQPFWVTAQHDYENLDGGMNRTASSLFIEFSTARAFGLVLAGEEVVLTDEDPDGATAFSGNVLDVPVIPAGYSLVVWQNTDNGNWPGDPILVGPTAAVTATVSYTYANAVPGRSGIVASIMRENSQEGRWGQDTQALALHPASLVVAQGETTTVPDIDMSESVLFEEKQISVEGMIGSDVDWTGLALQLSTGGLDMWFGLTGSNGDDFTVPSSFLMASSVPAGMAVGNSFSNGGGGDTGEWWQDQVIPAASGGDLDFDLMPPPTLLTPAGGANVPLATAEAMEISWQNGDPTTAFSDLIIEGFGPEALGVDRVWWNINLPGDVNSITLPPTDVPMFAPADEYLVDLGIIRVPGQTSAMAPEAFADFDDPDGTLRALIPNDRENTSGNDAFIEIVP